MKKAIIWIIAILITIASAIYQRKTGPTYPKEMEIELQDQSIQFTLPRSNDSDKECRIEIPVNDTTLNGSLHFKRFPVNEDFNKVQFTHSENKLIAYLPTQPPAGKLEYYVSLYTNDEIKSTEHVIIRFKGSVPAWALIPHILFIFAAMLISNVAGLFAGFKIKEHVFYGNLALVLLLLGGMTFGPIVQLYAFGEAWTGIPFGWDLTDNKTLIAFVFWLVAVIANRKNPKYRYTLVASIILFVIFIIPHSLFGSELDYTTGEVVTGIITYIF